MKKIYYADHSATTFLKEEVLREMYPYLKFEFGNPSSNYSIGRISKDAINKARCKVANAIGARSDEIYFTSGGSESDNMIISKIAQKAREINNLNNKKKNHIITSKIEHKAVLNTCKMLENEGFDITYLDVDSKGKINLDNLKENIKEETILVSIMYANNEIGTIQDVYKIGKICRENNVYFHTDAVQAIGNVKIDVQNLNIDMLSMSAHKFYGPKGVGAAYIKRGIEFDSFINGGGQEREKRAGTENVSGIVGLGKAIEIANSNIKLYNSKLFKFRNMFIDILKNNIDNIQINGDLIDRLPGNVNVTIDGIDSETLLSMLDMEGICASGGSACNSSSVKPSYVLKAIGLKDDQARCSVRFTFGDANNFESIKYIAYSVVNIYKKLNKSKNYKITANKII